MRLIMGQIEPECLELFALEFQKIADYDFVYTLASTNINQSASNLIQMYIKSLEEFHYGTNRTKTDQVVCP